VRTTLRIGGGKSTTNELSRHCDPALRLALVGGHDVGAIFVYVAPGGHRLGAPASERHPDLDSDHHARLDLLRLGTGSDLERLKHTKGVKRK
jgi:hypothetical protein